MQTATQLANLRPFVPNDPRIKAGPGRPPGIRKKIQRFLDAPGGTVDGEQLTMEERGILETMIKMTGGVAGKPVSEMAQLRAFDLIMCRRYGKPEQPIKQSGTLQVNSTTTPDEMQSEKNKLIELLKRHAKGEITDAEFDKLSGGNVQDAEFTDITVPENGESEQPVTISKHSDT